LRKIFDPNNNRWLSLSIQETNIQFNLSIFVDFESVFLPSRIEILLLLVRSLDGNSGASNVLETKNWLSFKRR
jgi:hypothetical protein